MPIDHVRVDRLGRRVGVFHPVHAVWTPEREDLTRAVTGPLVASAAIRESEVKYVASLGERQSRHARLIRKRIERAHLVVFSPLPAPSFSFPPPPGRIGLTPLPFALARTGFNRKRRPGLATRTARHYNRAPHYGTQPHQRQRTHALPNVHVVYPLVVAYLVMKCDSLTALDNSKSIAVSESHLDRKSTRLNSSH